MTEAAKEQGGIPGRRDAAVALSCLFLALGFGVLVAWRLGTEPARQYAAAYLVELGLSVDNVFVFALVFSRFGLSPARERSVLLWGVAGAIVMRTAILAAGIEAVRRFSWLIPVLGLVILLTGVRTALSRGARTSLDPSKGLLSLVPRSLPAWLTVLLIIEAADLVFALDSLPAVIAVTHDVRIAVASNLLAILGLRSLFIVVRSAMGSLRYLHAGVSSVLVFVGAKMAAEPWFSLSSAVSLGVIAAILGTACLASVVRRGLRAP